MDEGFLLGGIGFARGRRRVDRAGARPEYRTCASQEGFQGVRAAVPAIEGRGTALLGGSARYLLDGPSVAVGVIEEHEADVVQWVGGRVGVRAKLLNVADLNATVHELSMSSHDVGYNELQSSYRPRRRDRDNAATDHDRASRAGWRELNEKTTSSVLVALHKGRAFSARVSEGSTRDLT